MIIKQIFNAGSAAAHSLERQQASGWFSVAFCLAVLLFTLTETTLTGTTLAQPPAATVSVKPSPEVTEELPAELPWDYSPYRVLVWIASDDPTVNVENVKPELLEFLDRDFSSIWRTTLLDAPRRDRGDDVSRP